jgi:hypothetical protein
VWRALLCGAGCVDSRDWGNIPIRTQGVSQPTCRLPLWVDIYGWTFFFVNGPGAMATPATTFAAYASFFFTHGMPVTTPTMRTVAVAAILSATGVNYVGIRSGARVQTIVTSLGASCLRH